jgi:RNA polymerase sigma-70 factor (ECF subfamily)
MDASAPIRSAPLSAVNEESESSILSAPVSNAGLPAAFSDETLMVRLAGGCKEALEVLFRRYVRTVRAVAYRAVRDGSEADDLVQDVFLLVQRNAKAFDRKKGSARAWILQIARRRAISRHRYLSSRHFYNRIDLDDLASEPCDPRTSAGPTGNPIGERFGEADFQRVFEELSFNQRETLRLHFLEGYSLTEIAAKLGQTRGNIKHHYFRGLERLRKDLFSAKLPGDKSGR